MTPMPHRQVTGQKILNKRWYKIVIWITAAFLEDCVDSDQQHGIDLAL
jgi:hypothetical protein